MIPIRLRLPAGRSGAPPGLAEFHDRFFRAADPGDPSLAVSAMRAEVRGECERAASRPPGFFSLTAPAGGGKTLSLAAFALKHALGHGLRRILFVAPFTGSVETAAEALCERLGGDAPAGGEGDAEPPLAVVSARSFYRRLLCAGETAAAPSAHPFARCVILLDEAQSLPPAAWKPGLEALRGLVGLHGATVVLGGITPPFLLRAPGLPCGLEGVREIAGDPAGRHERARRVHARDLGSMGDGRLARALLGHGRALCVVNTEDHALRLFGRIGPGEAHSFLGARMDPARRLRVLRTVRGRLAAGAPCRLVGTPVVEGGADLDFPVVYRALAGLDAVARAAGRCNRDGRLPMPGAFFLFRPEPAPDGDPFGEAAECAAQTLRIHPDPLTLEACDHFHRLLLLRFPPFPGAPPRRLAPGARYPGAAARLGAGAGRVPDRVPG